jgi:hypothetical protein
LGALVVLPVNSFRKNTVMIIKQITLYLQERLSEQQALALWTYLLLHSEALELLRTYRLYRELYD